MNRLILSIFPGIDMLGMAFEEEGFTVVRGPDVIWGGDIRKFSPPAGVFAGVIGGPPCQAFSRMRFIQPLAGKRQGNLIPEFERCVAEADPAWFIMENVKDAPEPIVPGYRVHAQLLNNRSLGEEQNRERRISFGSHDGVRLDFGPSLAIFEAPLREFAITASAGKVLLGGSGKPKRTLRPPTIIAGHGQAPGTAGFSLAGSLPVARMVELQGLPDGFLEDAPFTIHGKRKVIGNGVPLPMGRAIAQAVVRAMNA